MRERRVVEGRAEEFYMGKEKDERGLVRAVCWRLWDVQDSCSRIPVCEVWGGIFK